MSVSPETSNTITTMTSEKSASLSKYTLLTTLPTSLPLLRSLSRPIINISRSSYIVPNSDLVRQGSRTAMYKVVISVWKCG